MLLVHKTYTLHNPREPCFGRVQIAVSSTLDMHIDNGTTCSLAHVRLLAHGSAWTVSTYMQQSLPFEV